MNLFFEEVLHGLESGKRAILCRVIKRDGTAPRGEGAKMAVFDDHSFTGTVGGGSIEAEAMKAAVRIFQNEDPFCETFHLNSQVHMVSGAVTICFEELPLFTVKEIVDQYRAGLNAWLVTRFSAFKPETSVLMDEPSCKAAARGLWDDQELPRTACFLDDGISLFVDPIMEESDVYLFGGGHVAQAVAPVLSGAGFRVRVFEDRPQFITQELFPSAAQISVGDFTDFTRDLCLTAYDYAAIMTHSPETDYEVLCDVLKTGAAYIGVLGSKKKLARILERLRESGFGTQDLSRIHTPIGLDIGAQTPNELAVSIAAELIQTRARLRGIKKRSAQ